MPAADESPLQTTVRERLTSFLRARGIPAKVSQKSDTVSVQFRLGERPHEVIIREDDVELSIDGKTAGSFDGADYDDENAVARDVLKHLDRELAAQKT